jgi:site-specific recombinase XerC
MILPDYRLIGTPARFANGRGVRAASFHQKFRLLADPARKVRTVSLKTIDLTAARRRAVKYVEARIRADLLARDPQARTLAIGISAALKEYLADLKATGNSAKQVATVKMRIERVIKQAKLKEYSHIESIVVTKAIAKLSEQHGFGTVTCNRYREAMRAWSRWMCRNDRWPTNPLQNMAKFKGDDTPTRQRTILTDHEFEQLLTTTLNGPDRRNLTGEQRFWLYMLASQSGLRAQELNSLKPTSFDLVSNPPTVTVHCTISKRRKTDTVLLGRDFARMLKPWLDDQDPDRRLWGCSASWYYKGGSMLRADLDAAGIAYERDGAVIDFHSFRALRITSAIMTGAPSRVVMSAVRLSSGALLARYTKIPQAAIADLVEAVPMPRVTLRVVG